MEIEKNNVLKTYFFQIWNTGNSIYLNIFDTMPKKIKMKAYITNTGLGTVPVKFDLFNNTFYAYEMYGANQSTQAIEYEFNNFNTLWQNQVIYTRNALAHGLLNVGFMVLVCNFIY